MSERYVPTHDEIAPYLRERLVSARTSFGMRIYNYTPRCQYSRQWDRVTTACRGLVLDNNGNLIALPFPKFFNVGESPETELDALPRESAHVFEKLDGSLGILFRERGTLRVATRGSMESPQALDATVMLHSGEYDLEKIPPDVTLLFEIISPQHRVIVDYGGRRELVVLGAYDMTTRTEVPWPDVVGIALEAGFPTAGTYDLSLGACLDQRESLPWDREGWVVRFASGLRVKVKSAEYLRVARLVQGISPVRVWENLDPVTGKVDIGFLELVPEELREQSEQWVRQIEHDWNSEWMRASYVYGCYRHLQDQKEFALAVQGDMNTPILGAVFSMRTGDHARAGEQIKKAIKPKGVNREA